MFVRIDRVHPFGIQHGDRIRQCVVRHMMVADDKIDSQLLGIFDLFDGFDTAVERDHQRDSVFPGVVDPFIRNPVSFVIPVRNIEIQRR